METFRDSAGDGTLPRAVCDRADKIEGAAQLSRKVRSDLSGRFARRGVTLIEAVLFISVALGLIVGGLVFFQQARLAAQTQDLIRLTNAIVTEVRVVYGRQRATDGEDPFAGNPELRQALIDFWGEAWYNLRLVNKNVPVYRAENVLVTGGSIPPQYHGGADPVYGQRLLSPWQKPLEVIVQQVLGDNQVLLTLYDTPLEICTRIAPMDAAGRSLLSDAVLAVGFGSPPALSGEVLPSQAADQCRDRSIGGIVGRVQIALRF
jgi:hypothetical protein